MCKIGVLMPVYNCKNYITRSLESILNQSYTNFKIYLIDDCSTDGTFEILQSFKDDRICLYRNSQNMGLVQSLNYGIKLIQEEYLARMDGDDFAFADRFEKQINYLENNLDIAVCGTQGYWTRFGKDFSEKLITYKWFYPEDFEEIKASLFFSSCFGHSSIMLRTHILKMFDSEKIYSQSYNVSCEDWDLWFRISKKYKLVNLPEFLMEYTIHDSSLHRSNCKKKSIDEIYLKSKMLEFYGINIIDNSLLLFYDYISKKSSYKSFLDIINLFELIYLSNKNSKYIDNTVLGNILTIHSYDLFLKSKNGFISFFTYISKRFIKYNTLSFKQYLKIILKCISLS